jgi:hypothetical protein
LKEALDLPGQRVRLDDFLYPFLLGTLMTYALMPHFASEAPRFVFAGEDLPGVETVFRRFNQTSVLRETEAAPMASLR